MFLKNITTKTRSAARKCGLKQCVGPKLVFGRTLTNRPQVSTQGTTAVSDLYNTCAIHFLKDVVVSVNIMCNSSVQNMLPKQLRLGRT